MCSDAPIIKGNYFGKETRLILITGASRGIGKYLIKRFIDDGENVSGTYNSTKPDSDLVPYLRKVNILDNTDIKNWINAVIKNKNNLVLINCAGANYNSYAHKADLNRWAFVINVNLLGTFNVISQILPKMRDGGYGRIINLSSVVSRIGVPGTSAYAASKSALVGLTKAIAVENSNRGITINNMNLGYFNIGMISEIPDIEQQIIKSKIPLNQFGDPEEIWRLTNYIISAGYLTGTSIDLNGGL
jgi:NAD(P)-dependent dehydrogenase (short-subunit alcohol dehydrogenase family)